MRMRIYLRAKMRHAVCAALVLLGFSHGVLAVGLNSFDIPESAAADSFREFSLQANLQILFSAEAVAGLRTREVRGDFESGKALALLLGGTGLAYEFVNLRTVVVGEPGAESGKITTGGAFTHRAHGGDAPATRVAQSEPAAPSSDVGASERSSVKDDGAGSERRLSSVPEILVRGSRSLNADIRRTEDDIQPYVIFGREQIDRSPALNVDDFLKARLPMNTASLTNQQITSSLFPSAPNSGVNLRGLGANQTLILIDGRRVPGASVAASDFAQSSIAGIPLSAIERIEVLPSSAGGIFGGAATGGVINIVRRRDYSSVNLQANYGDTFAHDASNMELSLSGGVAFEGGRSRVAFNAMHSQSDPLKANDRDFAARARNLFAENSPSRAYSSFQPPGGKTSNLCAGFQVTPTFSFCSGTPLTLDTGEVLSAGSTYLPVGYPGPTDGGAALGRNAGAYNLGIPDDGQLLLRTPTKNALSIDARREFGQRIQGFIDFSGSRSKSDLSGGDVSRIIFVPGDAPSNPFLQGVAVNVRVPGLGRPAENVDETVHVSGGAIVRLPREWAATLEHDWSRAKYEYQATSGFLLSDAGLSVLRDNAFRDLSAQPLDMTPYILPAPDIFAGPFSTTMRNSSLRASGPALHMPAGKLELSAAFERRNEETGNSLIESRFEGGTTTLYPSVSRDVRSYYLEAHLPLVAPSFNLRLARELEMQASVRHDDFETMSTTSQPTAPSPAGPFAESTYVTNRVRSTDFTVGLRYAPLRDIVFRSSLSTGFLPPSITQIAPFSQVADFSFGLTDPLRGNTDTYVGAPYTYVTGGNPGLRPEESTSFSAGFILTPTIIENLRFSADFTRIKKTDEVYSPSFQLLLDLESSFPDRVLRGAKLSGDPADWAGPITQLDISSINISSARVESYDFQIEYSVPAGRFGVFHLDSVATRMRQLERQFTIVSEPFDSVGYADGPLQWRGQIELRWERGKWSAGWDTQYFSSYSVTYADPVRIALNNEIVERQGSKKIDSQNYHDLWVHFDFGTNTTLLNGTTVSLGVQNVFDTSPPIVVPFNLTDSLGGYSTYGDPRLRRYSLRMQKTFGK